MGRCRTRSVSVRWILVLATGMSIGACQQVQQGEVQRPAAAQTTVTPAQQTRTLVRPAVVTFRGRALAAVPDELLVTLESLDRTTLLALEKATGGIVTTLSPFVEAALVTLPAGASLDDAATAAMSVPGVLEARPNAVVRGTGKANLSTFGTASTSIQTTSLAVSAAVVCPASPETAWTADGPLAPPTYASGFGSAPLFRYQWHLHRSFAGEAWKAAPTGGAGVTVAVLDTGVSAVPSLPAARLVNCYNALQPGGSCDDDNGHGTHMASILASKGTVVGVAPKATIVPVKVLDATMSGTELALVDGLMYAASLPDVNIVSMSLSLPPEYVPSMLLSKAIDTIAGKGILLVAASGNDGLANVSFPAAFPEVIAIGAAAMIDAEQHLGNPGYGNKGAALDLSGFGGQVTADLDANGVLDGILGESVDPATGAPQFMLTAGTSPAAAQVAGGAALLLGAGVPPNRVRHVLQLSARPLGIDGFDRGVGMGTLNLAEALRLAASPCYDPTPATERAYTEAMVYYTPSGSGVKANAVVRVVDEYGTPVAGVRVEGHFRGLGMADASTKTDGAGLAIMASNSIKSPNDGFTAFSVDMITHPVDKHPVRPVSAARFERLTYQLFSNLSGGLASDAVVLDVDASSLSSLGIKPGKIADSYMMRPMGSGLASSAIIFGFTPEYYLNSGLASTTMLFRSTGTGLASSAIVVDQSFFSTSLQKSWSTDTLLVRNYTQGSGLASSAIIWKGVALSSDAFFVGTDPVVLRMTSGAGLASSAIVWNSTMFNTSLLRSPTSSLSVSGVGLASSAIVQPFSSATISSIGYSWSKLSATYPMGSGLASSAIVARYDPYAYYSGAMLTMDPTLFLRANSDSSVPFTKP